MTAEIIDRLTLKDQSYGDIYNDIGKITRDKSDAFILGVAMGGTTSTMQNLMTSESALQEHAINLFMSKADRDYLTKRADNINKLQVTLNEAKTEDGKKIIENKASYSREDIDKILEEYSDFQGEKNSDNLSSHIVSELFSSLIEI